VTNQYLDNELISSNFPYFAFNFFIECFLPFLLVMYVIPSENVTLVNLLYALLKSSSLSSNQHKTYLATPPSLNTYEINFTHDWKKSSRIQFNIVSYSFLEKINLQPLIAKNDSLSVIPSLSI
jgi:hypothetical protein